MFKLMWILLAVASFSFQTHAAEAETQQLKASLERTTAKEDSKRRIAWGGVSSILESLRKKNATIDETELLARVEKDALEADLYESLVALRRLYIFDRELRTLRLGKSEASSKTFVVAFLAEVSTRLMGTGELSISNKKLRHLGLSPVESNLNTSIISNLPFGELDPKLQDIVKLPSEKLAVENARVRALYGLARVVAQDWDAPSAQDTVGTDFLLEGTKIASPSAVDKLLSNTCEKLAGDRAKKEQAYLSATQILEKIQVRKNEVGFTRSKDPLDTSIELESFITVAKDTHIVGVKVSLFRPIEQKVFCAYGCLTRYGILESSSGFEYFLVAPSTAAEPELLFKVERKDPKINLFVQPTLRTPYAKDRYTEENATYFFEVNSRTKQYFEPIAPFNLAATAKPITVQTIVLGAITEAERKLREQADLFERMTVPRVGDAAVYNYRADELKFARSTRKDVQRHFPVGSFAESLHAALLPTGWLFQRAHTEEAQVAALRTLARLNVLFHASQQEAPKSDQVEQEGVSFQARQALLKEMLPVMIMKAQAVHSPELQRNAILYHTSYISVLAVHEKLVQALRAFATLSENEAFALLGETNEKLGMKASNARQTKEELAWALYGAEGLLLEEVARLHGKLKLTCLTLERLHYSPRGFMGPPLELDRTVMEACSDN